jgi:putative restriction endonuclease
MNREYIKDLFEKITVWKRDGQRAPHKPLLALYALGRCYRKESRLTRYSDVDPVLKRLLIEFGPTRKSYHPEYPFWRLQNDGIWQLRGAEKVARPNTGGNVKRADLLRFDVRGGLTEELYSVISKDQNLLIDIARNLLEANFPPSIHEDILQAVGIDLEFGDSQLRKRDPQFRDRVLRAYEYRCAVCGFDVRLGDSLVALEAAHIKWYQAGGPDEEVNGVALCSLHHKLFDRGAFTLTDSMHLRVSERAHGSMGFAEWLLAFHGMQLRPPQRPTYYPEPTFIEWHVSEVFQGPPRYIAESKLQ